MLLRLDISAARRAAAVFGLVFAGWILLVDPSCAQQVTPIDWSRFQSPTEVTPFYQGVRTSLNNNARYNLNWVVNEYGSVATNETPTGQRFDVVSGNEAEIRSLAHISYGLSAMLKNGVYDATQSQLSQQTIRNRTIEMIHGAAYEHRASTDQPRMKLTQLFDRLMSDGDFPEGVRRALGARGFDFGPTRQPQPSSPIREDAELHEQIESLLSKAACV